jgi:hypothetical protein
VILHSISALRARRRPCARLRTTVLLLCLPWLVASGCALAGGQGPVRLIAQIAHPPLDEISGIARSSWPGIYWVHNDSGDTARIFAIDLAGEVVIPPFLRAQYRETVWPGVPVHGAWNIDWEDIALHDGMLYIADMGNNGNARRDLGVYVVPEPNPLATAEVRALKFLPVRYPDQQTFPAQEWHFDSEALFVDRGTLYFITKHRQPGRINQWAPGAKLYRLDTEYTDRVNVLTYVGRHDELSLATGADLCPDGERLAVVSYTAVWVFERPLEGDDWLSGKARRLPLNLLRTRQVEAITWRDAQTLLIANENRDLFEVDVAALRPVD